MANTTDLVFKKIVNMGYTSPTKAWYEEAPAVPFKLKGSDVWIEDIPQEPVEIEGRIKKFTRINLKKDTGVANSKCWLVVNPQSDTERLNSFISPRYGSKYQVEVYFNNDFDNTIGTAHPSGWFFDYEAGILTFDNDPKANSIQITVYQYVGRTADNMVRYDPELNNIIIF